MNDTRRAAFKSMRKYLKQEEVRKKDIQRFERVKLPDGNWALLAILKDRRVCSVSWKP